MASHCEALERNGKMKEASGKGCGCKGDVGFFLRRELLSAVWVPGAVDGILWGVKLRLNK